MTVFVALGDGRYPGNVCTVPWLWLASVCFGWLQLPSVGCSCLRLVASGSGWLRLASLGFAWLRVASRGFAWLRLASLCSSRASSEFVRSCRNSNTSICFASAMPSCWCTLRLYSARGGNGPQVKLLVTKGASCMLRNQYNETAEEAARNNDKRDTAVILRGLAAAEAQRGTAVAGGGSGGRDGFKGPSSSGDSSSN